MTYYFITQKGAQKYSSWYCGPASFFIHPIVNNFCFKLVEKSLSRISGRLDCFYMYVTFKILQLKCSIIFSATERILGNCVTNQMSKGG